MLKLSENPEYGFAVGRVRALEPQLLDRSRYERLIRARDPGEFSAALSETAYSRYLEGEKGGSDVPAALDQAAQDNYGFLAQYALDPWLLQLFQLPARYRQLKAAARDADYARQPSNIDATFDRQQQRDALELTVASDFLTGWLHLHADVENLRAFVRIKAEPDLPTSAERQAELADAWLGGGQLKLADLDALLTEPWDTAEERLGKPPPFGVGSEKFAEYVYEGVADITARGSIVRMERLGRELELAWVRQARYATFGHEPLAAYLLLQENELRNLRQLYSAKVAGLSEEQARDLVAYVE
jgi:vacuolar-type H+-ATPase subunit C/Vma6